MLNLNNFPSPPHNGLVTAYEADGKLYEFPPAEAKQKASEWLNNYNVEVFVGQENARSAYSKYEAKEAFFAHTETLWQRVTAAYYEGGVFSVLHQLSVEKSPSRGIFILSRGSAILMKLVRRLKHALPPLSRSPSLHAINAALLESSAGCGARVRFVSWHPHTASLAALYGDDSVRVFCRGRNLVPLLKHRLQKDVADLQWMPHSASVLGVACASGVLLWTLDPVSVVTRPSGSCLSILAHPEFNPVTAISWYAKGGKFVCAGGSCRDLCVWDVCRDEMVVVYKGAVARVTAVWCAPRGNRILVAYNTNTIKVFESARWSFDRWTLPSRCQSAVWSSCGRMVVFATQKEPRLFCLSFSDRTEGSIGEVGGASVATQIADLTPVVLDRGGEEDAPLRVGGCVKQLAWDWRSERLAVLFSDCSVVAVFHTYTQPQLHLAPGGWVSGDRGALPLHVSFERNVSSGAVLTTVWSDGEVRHVALQYTSHQHRPSAAPQTTAHLNLSHLLGQTADFSVLSSPVAMADVPAFGSPSMQGLLRRQNHSVVCESPILGSPIPRLFMSPS